MGEQQDHQSNDCVIQTGKVWTGVLVETSPPIYRKDQQNYKQQKNNKINNNNVKKIDK